MILGVAAVWDKRKGLTDIIAISDMLPDGYPIIVVGVSQKQNELLSEKMVGISRTNNTEELRELYGIADVFINPTYEDNYPTTNLEAKSCGTKVITYRTGGSPESADVVIDHGVENMIKTIIEDNGKWIRNEVVLDKLYASKEYIRLVTTN